jgi:hypothetical protein
MSHTKDSDAESVRRELDIVRVCRSLYKVLRGVKDSRTKLHNERSHEHPVQNVSDELREQS